MKNFLSFLALIFSTLIFGQKIKSNDPAVIFDNKLITIKSMEFLDPDWISNLNVIKRDTIIQQTIYKNQIHITSNAPESFDFLSLEEIKSEFTKVKSNDVVYMVNGTFIKDNVAALKLERNYILDVKVSYSNDFSNLQLSNSKFAIIAVLMKTKLNIKNKNKVLIKGDDVIAIK
jgi:hypothetical protein